MTDPVSPRLRTQYGTCDACCQLKHVHPDGRVREHNRFAAHGTLISPERCSGSGAPATEFRPAEAS